MRLSDVILLYEQRIGAYRPRWLGAFDDAPLVYHSYVQEQRAFGLRILPFMVALGTILSLANYLRISLPGYPWSLAVALAGLALLLAASPYRVGVAALRSVSLSPNSLHARLWILVLACLFLVVLGLTLALGFLWAALKALGIAP